MINIVKKELEFDDELKKKTDELIKKQKIDNYLNAIRDV